MENKYTVLLVNPTDKLIQLAKTYYIAEKRDFSKVYFSEENSVYLVKSIKSFDSNDEFFKMIEQKKKMMFDIEVNRFFYSVSAPGIIFSKFEDYFTISIRDSFSFALL